jgi:hypothetical protein
VTSLSRAKICNLALSGNQGVGLSFRTPSRK